MNRKHATCCIFDKHKTNVHKQSTADTAYFIILYLDYPQKIILFREKNTNII